jgi:O-Antigen ligase
MLLRIISKSIFILTVSLAFVVPFDSGRNAELQSRLILFSGLLSAVIVLFNYRNVRSLLPRFTWIALSIILALALVSSTLNIGVWSNLFGLPYVGVGVLSVIASVAVALHISQYSLREITVAIYVTIVALSIVSIPYGLVNQAVAGRLGGVFVQPDIMACFAGCGLIFGAYILTGRSKHEYYLYASQLFLLITLFMTQTRAVIYVIIFLFALYILRSSRLYRYVTMALAGFTMIIALQMATSSRLIDTQYVRESIEYRLSLQKVGFDAALDRPLIGFGAANVPAILDCNNLQAVSLQKTCSEGYYFNSTHNIFLDRILAWGVIPGVGLILLTIYGVYLSFTRRSYAFSSALFLVSIYYLTNVHNATLDLLYWVILITCLRNFTIEPKLLN